MLRREPTRIEMKPEDIEEFDAYVAAQRATTVKKDDDINPQTDKQIKESRIGVKSNASDSPQY